MPISRVLLLFLFIVTNTSHALEETAIVNIRLAAPLDQPQAEISGLSWCGDNLIILPQYPKRLSVDKRARFYTLSKQAILDYLHTPDDKALIAQPILVNENRLRKKVTIFDGYEAIECDGDSVWLAIEAVNLLGIYQSYLVQGSVDWSASNPSITIDPDRFWSLDSQSKMRNIGDEAIFTNQQQVFSVHEVNDSRIVDKPTVHVLDKETGYRSKRSFPKLPYRITDTTKLDDRNRFWAINYKYSGDKFSRNAPDPLADQYGRGTSHKRYYNVERLVEFELKQDRIVLSDRPPIQLEMVDVEGRNWEGLVRLDKLGFLLATDKHPETILGFVPISN